MRRLLNADVWGRWLSRSGRIQPQNSGNWTNPVLAKVTGAKQLTLPDELGECSLPFAPFDKAGPIPPPPHAPNEETVAAIQAAERGEVIRIGHPSNLIAELDDD